jgi:hypothetical protein
MITIKKPHIEIRNQNYYLISEISCDTENITGEIWYKATEEYADYLVDEVADAFVLPMLLVALKNQEDIKVEAPISEKLYYNIKKNILYTLSIPLNVGHKINVDCEGYIAPSFQPTAVGCGCSLGVDSFSAMIGHMSKDCPKSFRITHFTNFNVGAYGNDFEKSEQFFLETLTDVRKYAQEKGMPLVLLESNFGLFFEGDNFNWSGPVRTMSAVLALQKLFKRYYYASGTTNEGFQYTTTMCEFASLIIPMFSTENTEFIVADQDKTRIEKTAAIVDNPDAQHYLDVCWKRIKANRGETRYLQYPYKNCTRCSKCQRTLLTIDILGYTDKFKEIFDVEYFKQNRDEIVKNYVTRKDENHYFQEVYQLMIEKGYPIPQERKTKKVKSFFRSFLNAINKKIKRFFNSAF